MPCTNQCLAPIYAYGFHHPICLHLPGYNVYVWEKNAYIYISTYIYIYCIYTYIYVYLCKLCVSCDVSKYVFSFLHAHTIQTYIYRYLQNMIQRLQPVTRTAGPSPGGLRTVPSCPSEISSWGADPIVATVQTGYASYDHCKWWLMVIDG